MGRGFLFIVVNFFKESFKNKKRKTKFICFKIAVILWSKIFNHMKKIALLLSTLIVLSTATFSQQEEKNEETTKMIPALLVIDVQKGVFTHDVARRSGSCY